MKRLKSTLLIVMAFFFVTGEVMAGEIKLKSYTERKVYYDNEEVVLIYEVQNTSLEGVVMPVFDDFEILRKQSQGPNTSVYSINGKTTYTQSFKLYFLLKPRRKGVLKIPEAELYAEGKKYTSPAFDVEVKSLGDMAAVLEKGRVVKATVSNNRPFVGEAFTVKFELQTLDQIENSEQFIKGLEPVNYGTFHAKDITDHKGSQVGVSGKTVTVVEIQKSVLIPVKEGVFKVPARILEYTVPLYRQMGFMRVQTGNESRKVEIPEVVINVKPLPPAPDDFSGLVGQFSLTAKSDKSELQVNDAVTVRYKLEGVGNIFAFDELNLEWPSQWEVFEPVSKDDSKVTTMGYKGTKVMEYVAIPRNNGEYETPEFSFSYFNLRTKKYERLSAASKTILVSGEAGGNAVFAKGEVVKRKVDGGVVEELRYIKIDDEQPNLGWKGFFGSTSSVVTASSIGLASVLFFLFYKPKTQSDDEKASKRRKMAFKTASKVLKEAEKELESDGNAFFYQVELAFNAFLKDKLGMSNSDFNREELKTKLLGLDLKEEEVESILKLQSKCGMARYSPIGVDKKMVFEEVKQTIEKLS